MKPKLILHAGTHKTGTTAIQAFCVANRDALERRGISYPRLPVAGQKAAEQHHDFTHAFSDRPVRLSPEAARALGTAWAARGAETGHLTFISAEPIWRHVAEPDGAADGDDAGDRWIAGRDAYLARLAESLSGFDTRVVLVFRNPVDFIQSLYIELISSSQGGVKRSFPDFRAASLGGVLRYGENVRLIARHFPAVQCLIYEDLCDTDLLDAFFAAAGIDVAGMKPGSVVRKSMRPAEAVITNAIKLMVPGGVSRNRVRRFLDEAKISAEVEAFAAANPKTELWEDAAARQALFDAMAPQFDILAADFGLDTSRWARDLAARPAPRPVVPLDAETRVRLKSAVAKRLGEKTGKHAAGAPPGFFARLFAIGGRTGAAKGRAPDRGRGSRKPPAR